MAEKRVPDTAPEKEKAGRPMTGGKASGRRRRLIRCAVLLAVFAVFMVSAGSAAVSAAPVSDALDAVQGEKTTMEIIEMFTLMALIPSVVMMASSFTRIVIVLSFLRNALGLQQTPPNQVLVGIALFLTLFIMSPVLTEINRTAYEPYKAEQITQEKFLETAAKPLKKFMLKQTKKDDLKLFTSIAKTPKDTSAENLPITVVIPSFMTSELKRAFMIGFLIFIPFLIIDLIVSSTLMSMGMIMLPPAMISLPFKLLLFVLVDGWQLLFKTLVQSFKL